MGPNRCLIPLMRAFGASLGKCDHGEATSVVALELLGRDKGKTVEDVAKDVQKFHAMQAIMK